MTAFDEVLSELTDHWLPNLQAQVVRMHHRREVHDELQDLLHEQGHPARGLFADTFHDMYLESQVMTLRRLADRDNRTISLVNLIGQLQHSRRSFTRERFVRRWLQGLGSSADDERERLEVVHVTRLANEAFDRWSDAPNAPVLGGRRLDADRKQLVAATQALAAYTDQTVAHSDRRPGEHHVTYGDLERAIDHVGELLKQYYLLLTGGSIVDLVPVPQGDWLGPFRSALAPSE